MTFALVSHVQTTPSGSGGTSSAISTVGAILLVCGISVYVAGGAVVAPTDSQSNTWIALTSQASSETEVRLFYCISPSTSATHTFTNSSSNFDTVANIIAFSATAPPTFDSESGVGGSGTTLAAGSITPSGGDNLVITSAGGNGFAAPTVDSGFTITDAAAYSGGTNEGGSIAYLIQTSATPANPTWTWNFGPGSTAAVNAVFLVATVVGAIPRVSWSQLASILAQ